MEKIKVIVNGAKGKMGQETVKAVQLDKALELVAQIDLGDDLAAKIKELTPQVVVDFTTPKVVMENIRLILNTGTRAVVGTTGISPENLTEIKELCEKNKTAAMVVPNFAIGAVLMMKLSKEAARYLPKVEIIELHHDQKLDAPSGTAIKTAEMIKEETKGEVPIHSVRLPGYVAHQEVIFGTVGQTLKIRHDSISRESFMPGVVLSIKKVVESPAGKLTYGLEKIL